MFGYLNFRTFLQYQSGFLLLVLLCAFIIFDCFCYSNFEIRKIHRKGYLIFSVLYGLFLFWITLYSREKADALRYNLSPIWEYIRAFKFDSDGLKIISKEWLYIILNNIYLFVPLGFCVSKVIHREWKVHVLIAFFLPLLVELTQLITRRGVFEVNDIINNSLGYILGFVISYITECLFAKKCPHSNGYTGAEEPHTPDR